MKFFENIKTLNELKKAYKELARKYHPDLGGSVEEMQKINAEYDDMLAWFAKYGDRTEKEKASAEQGAEIPSWFRDIISKLVTLTDIQIEIIGGWIWLSGAVGKHLRKIQSLGFEYSRKQNRYYKNDGVKTKRASRLSMDTIREIYGSQIINTESTKSLTC